MFISRTCWYAAALVVACALSMAIGYAVVRTATEDPAQLLARAQAHRAEGDEIRGLSKQLAQLTSEYLDRIRARSPETEASFQSWLSNDFKPALKELERRMLASKSNEKPLAALLGAVQRVAAMAEQPDRSNLRIVATDDVLEATTQAEAYLAPSIDGNEPDADGSTDE